MPERTMYWNKRDWLAARADCIGASESPAIMEVPDLPNWLNAVKVYESKVMPLVEDAGNELMQSGQYLEAGIIRWACEREGLKPEEPYGSPNIYHYRLGDVLAASPDASVRCDGEDGFGTLQVKNVEANEARRREWGVVCPLHVQAQVQHEMLVCGYSWGYVAACLGGTRLVMYRIAPDAEYQRILRPTVERWWNEYVSTRTVPPYSWNPEARATVARLFGEIEGEVDLPDEADEHLNLWELADAALGLMKSSLEEEKGWFVQQLTRLKGDVGMTPQGRRITWKANKNGKRNLRRQQKEN